MRAGQIGVSYGANALLSAVWHVRAITGMLLCLGMADAARGQCLPQWTQRFDVPAQRRDPAMAFDSARGVMVMIGGFPGSNDPRPRQTWEWQGLRWILRDDVPVGPIERLDTARMVFDSARGVILLRNHNRSNGGETWEYDGQTWTWISADGPLTSDFTMAYDAARGETLLWSECDRGTWSWDGAAWTHRTLEPIRELAGFEMAYDAGREVVVMFGFADGAAETWEWQGESWELRFTGGPPARTDHTMAYDEQRGVVVIHGGKIGAFRFDDTWTWNGTTWALVAAGQPSERSAHVMAYDALRGEMILFAGQGASSGRALFNDTWAWDGQAWTLADEGEPLARSAQAMVYDRDRGVAVMYGGIAEFTDFADTWQHDGSRWRRVSLSGPGERCCPGMAYDSTRRESMLFGGSRRNDFLGDTWLWNGLDWTEAAQSGPSIRNSPAVVFDKTRGVAVLFGGWDGTDTLGDTWIWDGEAWSLAATTGPERRSIAAVAYDDAREMVVLFGGFNVQSRAFGDTWGWDGAEWNLLAQSGPTPRWGATMAYDENAGQVVLFGGENDNGYPDDVWAWTGESWAEVLVSGAPPRQRRFATIVYAGDRKAFLMFGGDDEFTMLADTWEMSFATPDAGDLNCDCSVNALDIEPFILALFDPQGYVASYPDCDRMLGDMNADGNVDALDIEPFIELLFNP